MYYLQNRDQGQSIVCFPLGEIYSARVAKFLLACNITTNQDSNDLIDLIGLSPNNLIYSPPNLNIANNSDLTLPR